MIKDDEIKRKIIEIFYKNNIFIGIDSLSYLFSKYTETESYDEIEKIANSLNENIDINLFWTNKILIESFEKKGDKIFNEKFCDFNWKELERAVVLYQKGSKKKPYTFFKKYLNDILGNEIKKEHTSKVNKKNSKPKENNTDIKKKKIKQEKPKEESVEKTKKTEEKKLEKKAYDVSEIPEKDLDEFNIKLVKKCNPELKDISVSDFKNHFIKRLTKITSILKNRPEIKNLTSIEHLESRKDEDKISLVGIVYGVYKTRNDNYFIELEDRSGKHKVFVSKDEAELVKKCESLIEDEVIGVNGRFSRDLFITNEIIFPDVPNGELKSSNKEEYVVFISDIHVGSNLFLEDSFNNFIDWLNGDYGDKKQREIAKKVKYVFVLGDLVDGIGIYPSQQDELNIDDIYLQYSKVSEYLSKLDKNLPIIIIPGNHDAVRLAEPQSGLPKDVAFDLWKMPNVFIFSNPSIVNIGSYDGFSGFNVLAYHGYSYDYYVNNINELRLNGGYDKITNTMKFLLKKRHLSPKHGGSTYLPDPESDDLVIDKVPDFFVSGHVHKNDFDQYKKTSLISASTFQAKTPFQEKLGHDPTPGIVPVVNLKTREVNMFDFN